MAVIVNAAASDDGHITIFPNEKIVIDQLFNPTLSDNNRDVDNFIFGARADIYVDAGLILFCFNLNIFRVGAGSQRAVFSNVICPFRCPVHVGDLFQ